MDNLYLFLELIRDYLIKGVFISVVVLLIARAFYKNNLDIETPTRYLKWLLLGYTFYNLLIFLLAFLIPEASENYAFFSYSRATGPYKYAYLLMFLMALVPPLLLLIKRFGRSLIFMLFVGIAINIGWLFESFVIHVTSIHRDFAPESWSGDAISGEAWLLLPYDRELLIFLRGLVLGILLLIFGNIKRFKAT